MEENLKDILFVCIGNGNIVGDSLGPLVGSFLKIYEKTNKIQIIGQRFKEHY